MLRFTHVWYVKKNIESLLLFSIASGMETLISMDELA